MTPDEKDALTFAAVVLAGIAASIAFVAFLLLKTF